MSALIGEFGNRFVPLMIGAPEDSNLEGMVIGQSHALMYVGSPTPPKTKTKKSTNFRFTNNHFSHGTGQSPRSPIVVILGASFLIGVLIYAYNFLDDSTLLLSGLFFILCLATLIALYVLIGVYKVLKFLASRLKLIWAGTKEIYETFEESIPLKALGNMFLCVALFQTLFCLLCLWFPLSEIPKVSGTMLDYTHFYLFEVFKGSVIIFFTVILPGIVIGYIYNRMLPDEFEIDHTAFTKRFIVVCYGLLILSFLNTIPAVWLLKADLVAKFLSAQPIGEIYWVSAFLSSFVCTATSLNFYYTCMPYSRLLDRFSRGFL
jgi:hypothetical protein